jgi:hypothetical protein
MNSINKEIATSLSSISADKIEVNLNVNGHTIKLLVHKNNIDGLVYILNIMNPDGKSAVRQNNHTTSPYNKFNMQTNAHSNNNKMSLG